MLLDLVRIGNSRGIRIPKSLIEQCRFAEKVELRPEGDCLIIAPAHRPRQGWDEAFRRAGEGGRDELLLEPMRPSSFDLTEWRW
jgi:antitoxin MazE